MDTVGDGLPLLFLGFIIIFAFLFIVFSFFYLGSFGFFRLGLCQGLLKRILNMMVVLIRSQIFILPFEYNCLLLADTAHGLFKGFSLLATRCLLWLFTLSPLCA
jgi:hypothetical protein